MVFVFAIVKLKLLQPTETKDYGLYMSVMQLTFPVSTLDHKICRIYTQALTTGNNLYRTCATFLSTCFKNVFVFIFVTVTCHWTAAVELKQHRTQ